MILILRVKEVRGKEETFSSELSACQGSQKSPMSRWPKLSPSTGTTISAKSITKTTFQNPEGQGHTN